MHLDAEGKEILDKLALDRFDVPSDQNYAPVQRMIEVVEGR
jgi:hypothetical protein